MTGGLFCCERLRTCSGSCSLVWSKCPLIPPVLVEVAAIDLLHDVYRVDAYLLRTYADDRSQLLVGLEARTILPSSPFVAQVPELREWDAEMGVWDRRQWRNVPCIYLFQGPQQH